MTKDRCKEQIKEWISPLNDKVQYLNASPDSFDFVKDLNEPNLPLCHFCFRKKIFAEKLAGKLVALVAARSMYKLHINGQFVMTGPARSPESFLYVDEIDIAKYIHHGKNIIALEIMYVGPRGEYDFGSPGFSLHLECDNTVLLTEESWKCRDWQAYRAKSEAGSMRMFYPAEMIDLEHIDLFWPHSDYDDSDWPDVKEICEVTSVPELRPRPMLLPELNYMPEPIILDCGRQINEEFITGALSSVGDEASFCYDQQDAYYLYDFRGTVSGLFEIDGDLPKSATLRCDYLEWVDRFSGSSDRTNCFDVENNVAGFSVIGNGKIFHYQTWHPYSCRYMRITIKGLKPGEKANVRAVKCRELCALPTSTRSQVMCSDPALANIIDASMKTLRVCAPDMYVDCSSHERRIYLHDSLWQIEAGNIFYGDSAISQTFLDIVPDCSGYVPQYPFMPDSGTLCCHGRKSITLGHNLTWILQGFVHYRFCGMKPEEEFICTALRMLEDIHGITNKEGLIEYRDNICYFLDWSKIWSDEGVYIAMNALYYKVLALMAGATENPELAERQENLRHQIQSLSNPFIESTQMRMSRLVPDMFVRKNGKLYPYNCKQTKTFGFNGKYPRSETTQNWLLWSGVLDSKHEERLWEIVRSFRINEEPRFDDNHLYGVVRSGIFGLWPRLSYAFEKRDSEVVYRDIHDICEPMLAVGNTLWESICADSRSNAHAFVSYAGTLLFKCLTGILPGPEQGYEKPVIAPMPGKQDWCRAFMKTQKGIIGVNWQNSADKFTLTVTIPEGMTACVQLPPKAAAIMANNGAALTQICYDITKPTKFEYSRANGAAISILN